MVRWVCFAALLSVIACKSEPAEQAEPARVKAWQGDSFEPPPGVGAEFQGASDEVLRFWVSPWPPAAGASTVRAFATSGDWDKVFEGGIRVRTGTGIEVP